MNISLKKKLHITVSLLIIFFGLVLKYTFIDDHYQSQLKKSFVWYRHYFFRLFDVDFYEYTSALRETIGTVPDDLVRGFLISQVDQLTIANHTKPNIVIYDAQLQPIGGYLKRTWARGNCDLFWRNGEEAEFAFMDREMLTDLITTTSDMIRFVHYYEGTVNHGHYTDEPAYLIEISIPAGSNDHPEQRIKNRYAKGSWTQSVADNVGAKMFSDDQLQGPAAKTWLRYGFVSPAIFDLGTGYTAQYDLNYLFTDLQGRVYIVQWPVRAVYPYFMPDNNIFKRTFLENHFRTGAGAEFIGFDIRSKQNIYMAADPLSGLTIFFNVSPALYTTHFLLILLLLLLINIIIHTVFDGIRIETNRFYQISQEFVEGHTIHPSSQRLVNYFHSLLISYQKITTSFLPKYKIDPIVKGFKKTGDDFGASLQEIVQLREQELRHQAELARKEKESERLTEIDRLKTRFFTNMSHEFRTPLTLILGPVKNMMKKKRRGKEYDDLKVVHQNAERLLELINQILDLAKIDANKLTLNRSVNDMVPFLNRTLLFFESLARLRKIRLKFSSDPARIFVSYDEQEMEKVFINLIGNAFKFTPAGGDISIKCMYSESEKDLQIISGIGTREGETYLKPPHIAIISISNTGTRIPPESIAGIFDRFNQAGYENISGIPGSGIGLALAKEIVELHQGIITAESGDDGLTSFNVFLPALDPGTAAPVRTSDGTGGGNDNPEQIRPYITGSDSETTDISPEPGPAKTGTESIRILIVEDSREMRGYIISCLPAGYRYIEAGNGKAGMEKAGAHSPDLIISDVMMPQMDGFEFCSQIKSDARTSHIPVILLTAKASGDSRIEGLETGADDYLTKPFDRRELSVRVKNLLRQRKKLQEKFRQQSIIQPGEITTTSVDERLLQRVIDTVEEYIGDPGLNTALLAREVGVSRMLLNTKLRALTGQSTGEFIRIMRLKRAAQLLQQGHGNVTQVAYDVGFQSLSYFARVFRTQFGLSPSEYLTQLKSDDPK